MDKCCEECGLYQYSPCIHINGRGVLDKTTNVILIGEAPGPDEAKKGRVFIGRAGRTLDSMLKAYQDDLVIYITNSVKCFPPISTTNPEKGFRVPKYTEIELCKGFLIEELELASKDVLLMPLGNTALSALLGKEHKGITKVLGQFTQVLMDNNVTYTALPNYHPSYILRNYHKREDFEKVMKIAVDYVKRRNSNCLQENNKQ